MIISYTELNLDKAIDVGDAGVRAVCIPMIEPGWYCSLNIDSMTGVCYYCDDDDEACGRYDIEIADIDAEIVYNYLTKSSVI